MIKEGRAGVPAALERGRPYQRRTKIAQLQPLWLENF